MSTKIPVLSRRDVDDLYPSLRDQYRYLESRRDPEPAKSPGERLVATAEVAAGSAGIGLLAGRLGTASLGGTGIPIGLAIGAAGHALSFFGLAGRFGEHVQNVSDGAIAGWLALWAAAQGGQMRRNAGEQGGGEVIAGVPQRGGAPPRQLAHAAKPLTEAELQAIAQRRR